MTRPDRAHHERLISTADSTHQDLDQRVQTAKDRLAAYEVRVQNYIQGPKPKRGSHV